jgi:hypothetical protein
MSTSDKTDALRSVEQIEKQLADLATLKQKAESHGARDFASRTALKSLCGHERSLQEELRAAKLRSTSGDGDSDHTACRSQLFISYSHQDRPWFEKLQKHLKPYLRNATISVWDDTRIKAGVRWKDEIRGALKSARVAVLLVSPDFLVSDFIAERALPPLLESGQKEGLTIVWIPVSASCYTETEIADYQATHDPSQPLDSLSPTQQHKVLTEICTRINSAFTSSSQS